MPILYFNLFLFHQMIRVYMRTIQLNIVLSQMIQIKLSLIKLKMFLLQKVKVGKILLSPINSARILLPTLIHLQRHVKIVNKISNMSLILKNV